MKSSFAALLSPPRSPEPASAVTFPSLTTIYVVAGVTDGGGAAGVGSATAFHCLNVSGVTTSVRFVVLNGNGAVVASLREQLLTERRPQLPPTPPPPILQVISTRAL